MRLKVSSVKWRPFCLGEDELMTPCGVKDLGQHWSRQWLGPSITWTKVTIVNLTLGNKPGKNGIKIFIQWNRFKKIAWKMFFLLASSYQICCLWLPDSAWLLGDNWAPIDRMPIVGRVKMSMSPDLCEWCDCYYCVSLVRQSESWLPDSK